VSDLAFVVGLCIAAIGTVGSLVPSSLDWIARHSMTSGAFYAAAAIRVVFGLLLLSVASASRAPRALRALGWAILLAGIATALTGFVGIERAQLIIESWMQRGSGVVRLTGLLIVALGGFVAYSCAPRRRAD
jgi:hypothetical protein